MNISTLASAAMALLGPYLVKGAEEFAKVAGKAAAEKIGALYQAIKEKFKGDDYAKQTLARTEEQPTSKSRQTALESLLVELMEQDTKFAEMVLRLVQEGQASGAGDVQIATGSYIAQAAHGSTATVTAGSDKHSE